MKKVFKEILGVVCGEIGGFLAHFVIYYLLCLIWKIPILNQVMLGYSAGSSWYNTILVTSLPVLLGGFIAIVVAGRAKWYSVTTICIHVFPIITALLTSQLGLGLLLRRGFYIIPAVALLVFDARDQ